MRTCSPILAVVVAAATPCSCMGGHIELLLKQPWLLLSTTGKWRSTSSQPAIAWLMRSHVMKRLRLGPLCMLQAHDGLQRLTSQSARERVSGTDLPPRTSSSSAFTCLDSGSSCASALACTEAPLRSAQEPGSQPDESAAEAAQIPASDAETGVAVSQALLWQWPWKTRAAPVSW